GTESAGARKPAAARNLGKLQGWRAGSVSDRSRAGSGRSRSRLAGRLLARELVDDGWDERGTGAGDRGQQRGVIDGLGAVGDGAAADLPEYLVALAQREQGVAVLRELGVDGGADIGQADDRADDQDGGHEEPFRGEQGAVVVGPEAGE